MNLQETVLLIEALKASGVTRFKSHEHEIELSPVTTELKKVSSPSSIIDAHANIESTEKLKNLMNTISMSPEELANKMFPDGAI